MAPTKRPKVEPSMQKQSIMPFFKSTSTAVSSAKPSLNNHNINLDNDNTLSKTTLKSDVKLPTSSSLPSLQRPSGDSNVAKLSQSTSAPILKSSSAATFQQNKPRKDPDASYLESKRPSKEVIENLVVPWKVSLRKNRDSWQISEEVTLIRAKECATMQWNVIHKLFPNRTGQSVERRYKKYLVKSKNDPEITVPFHLLPSEQSEPPNAPYKPQKRSSPDSQETDQPDVDTTAKKCKPDVPAAKRQKNDGPLKYSLRPSKETIETLVIASEKSNAQEKEPWSVHDDVRLIRLKECLKLHWPQIKPFFPGRKNDACEKRYQDYLRAYKADPPIHVPEHLIYPGSSRVPENLLQALIDHGQSRIISSSGITVLEPIDTSNRLEMSRALGQARALVSNMTKVPKKLQATDHSSMQVFLSTNGKPTVDAQLGRALSYVKKLQQWQLNQVFDNERHISLRTLIAEIDYEDLMDDLGYADHDQENASDIPVLPNVLHPQYECDTVDGTDTVKIISFKIVVHDDVALVIGISRKSSVPSAAARDEESRKLHPRARKYAQFYLDRCHVGKAENCCLPKLESVVIFGSSNTDFENSSRNGINDLRKMLEKLKDGEKAVLVCTQTDGICTNILGLEAFLAPFLKRAIDIDIMVWWSNEEYYIYNVRKVFAQLTSNLSGRDTHDQYYQDFLGKSARIARNKEGMARASRANKQQEGLGRRNVLPIAAKDYLTDLKGPEDTVPSDEKRSHNRQDQERNSSIKEIILSKTSDGLLRSPIDESSFDSHKQVVEYIVNIIMASPQNERKCPFCDKTFDHVVRSFRIMDHLERHIFERLVCDECGQTVKTERDMSSHKESHKSEKSKVPCPECGVVFFKDTLQTHIQEAHVRSEQVTLFGTIMGVREWKSG